MQPRYILVQYAPEDLSLLDVSVSCLHSALNITHLQAPPDRSRAVAPQRERPMRDSLPLYHAPLPLPRLSLRAELRDERVVGGAQPALQLGEPLLCLLLAALLERQRRELVEEAAHELQPLRTLRL